MPYSVYHELCWILCNYCRDNREHANYNKAGRSGSKLFKEVIWEWAVNENDIDSREIQDLVHVNAEVDGRSRV